MSDVEQPRLAAVSGELCLWRVFEVNRDFADRPADGTGDRMFSVPLDRAAESLVVVLGAFPERVRQALIEHRTRGMYLLNRFTGAYMNMSVEELESAVAALEGQWSLDDLEIGHGLHLAIEIRRAVPLMVNPTRRYLWDDDGSRPDERDFDAFAAEAGKILDSAMAWLLPSLGDGMQLSRLVVPGKQAYLLTPGKAALTMPKLVGSAKGGVVSASTWAEQSWQQLADTLDAYPSRMTEARKLLASPARWLALSLGEKDAVRKFLFAYCGLETLVNKVISLWQPALVESLSKELRGAPVTELLWPNAQDDQYPHRNLVFRFAATATLVSRDSAEADTTIFRMIAKKRNGLAHGSVDDLDALPHAEATALLQRYIRFVAASANSPAPPVTRQQEASPEF